jgi:predicted nuclease of predicted toxin-antitoxin system
LLFLVDAQLPPSRQAGCQAVHLVDLGLLEATDRQIWDEAVSRSAVLVTKDRDFALRRTASNDGPTPAIIDAIERDEAVIEFAGR